MTKYEEYALVTKELDVLEAKKELLRKEIEEILPEEGYKDEIVNAFWTAKKKWTYSPKIDGLTAELKVTKAKEEEDGTATSEETKQLTIKVK